MYSSSSNSLSDFDKALLASNLVGAKTLEELYEIEQNITADRILQLKLSPLSGAFDYTHLKSIHYALFKDIYAWAGKDRCEMGYIGTFRKGETEFTRGAQVPQVAEALFDALADENYFIGLERERFIMSMASFLNGLNILHPFREGNGRVQRLFVEMLASYAGYDLDLSTVSKNVNVQACILGAKGQLVGFEKMISYGLS